MGITTDIRNADVLLGILACFKFSTSTARRTYRLFRENSAMAPIRKPALHWLMPAAAGVYLFLTAVLSTPSRYSLPHAAMLAALYGLLALAMYLGTQLATRWGHAAGLVFSAGAAFFLTLHLREQTRPGGVTSSLNELPVLVSFVGVCLVVCLLYYLATYAFAARPMSDTIRP